MNYRRQKQAFNHDPENGIYGDCSRTVIACLLGIPRDNVPHVHVKEDSETFFNREKEYLKSKGLWRVHLSFSEDYELDTVLASGKNITEGREYGLVGTSANGTNHIVICHEDKIVWDTSRDDSGIVGPALCGDGEYRWLIEIIVRDI